MLHSIMNPMEKRNLDRELRALGMPTNKANAITRIVSRHLDIVIESRRKEWAAMAGLTGHQLTTEPQEVEG